MKLKQLLAMFLALALLVSLCACGSSGADSSADTSADTSAEVSSETEEGEEEEETVQPFALGYYAGVGINPYTCDNSQNQTIVGLVYEPLFQIDESFQATACIAKSISVSRTQTGGTADQDGDEDDDDNSDDEDGEDGDDDEDDDDEEDEESSVSYSVTAVITLREDVVFSDGSALTSDDVVYSLKLAMDSDSIYASRLSSLSTVSASGDYKVTLTFTSGNTSVAALLDIPIVKSGTGEDKVPVGTGPYQVELKDGSPYKLVQNTYWWQAGKSYTTSQSTDPADSEDGDSSEVVILGETTYTISLPLEEIGLYIASDSEELIFGYSSGAISMVSTDLTGTDSLSFGGSGTVFDYETTNLLYLGFNTDSGACEDQNVRNAIYQSVDRETLVRKSLASHGVVAYMPVSPSSSLYSEELEETLAYDLETAQELCQSAGATGTLLLIVNSDSSFKVDMANEIKDELEEAGFSVEVEALEWSDFTSALEEGDYDLYLGETRMSNNFDLAAFLNKSGSLNYSGFRSSTLTSKLNALYAATGDDRISAAEELYTALAEEAPFAPLCFKNYSILAQKGYLEREYATQSNLFYQFYRWSFSAEVLEADGTFS